MSFRSLEGEPISISLMTSKDAIGDGKVEFLLRIIGSSSARSRVNVIYAIDASKSMDGERLFFAKHAALKSLEFLETGDGVAVVRFCRKSEIVFGPAKLDSEDVKKEVVRKIASIKTCPGTNIEAALMDSILAAKDMISKFGGVAIIVLITDGEPNFGEKDPKKLKELIKKYVGGSPITITAVGVGSEYNEKLLSEIAEAGGGVLEHVSDIVEIDKPLTREVLRAAKTVAANVKARIRVTPGVKVEVYGWDYEVDDDTVEVSVGSVAANEVVEIPGEAIVEDTISSMEMEVRVSYIDPLTQRTWWRGPLLVRLAAGEPSSTNNFVTYKVRLFKSLEEIKRAIERRDYARALELIAGAAEATMTLGDTSLHEKTVDIATLLERGMFEEASKRLFSLTTEIRREQE
jgi:Ca-activated chloride channel family protein